MLDFNWVDSKTLTATPDMEQMGCWLPHLWCILTHPLYRQLSPCVAALFTTFGGVKISDHSKSTANVPLSSKAKRF